MTKTVAVRIVAHASTLALRDELLDLELGFGGPNLGPVGAPMWADN
jgi:hypothetical protein